MKFRMTKAHGFFLRPDKYISPAMSQVIVTIIDRFEISCCIKNNSGHIVIRNLFARKTATCPYSYPSRWLQRRQYVSVPWRRIGPAPTINTNSPFITRARFIICAYRKWVNQGASRSNPSLLKKLIIRYSNKFTHAAVNVYTKHLYVDTAIWFVVPAGNAMAAIKIRMVPASPTMNPELLPVSLMMAESSWPNMRGYSK